MAEEEAILDFSHVSRRDEEAVLDFSLVAEPPPRPTLSEEQSKVRDHKGNTLVIAAPGAGKTEILIQRHERLEEQGARCLSVTFTIAAANEIRRRIPGAEASTIHSFCFKHEGYNWTGNYPTLLKEYVEADYKVEYDEVLVDEVQNLSPLMLAAIRAIPKQSLFAVGDPYQSCYIGSWAGNAWDAPAMGLKAFDALENMCDVLEIKGNRRSGGEVINLLERLNRRSLVALGPKKLKRVLVAARSHRALEEVSEKLKELNVPHIRYKRRDQEDTKYDTFGESPKIDLMVTHQLIGTEYREVFILDWMPPYRGSHEDEVEAFNLLYTAAARASEKIHTVDLQGRMGMCSYLPRELSMSIEDMLDYLEVVR